VLVVHTNQDILKVQMVVILFSQLLHLQVAVAVVDTQVDQE
jgi:hypothetical protein